MKAYIHLVSLFVVAAAAVAHGAPRPPGFPPPPQPTLKEIVDDAGQATTAGYFDYPVSDQALFNGPTLMTGDGAGDAWVLDSNNLVIRAIYSATNGGGVHTWKVGLPVDPFYIGGIAVDPVTYDLFISDSNSHVIWRLDRATGQYVLFAGSTALTPGAATNFGGYVDGVGSSALFTSPSGLAFDANRNLYVADSGNHAIRKVTIGGVVSTVFRDTSGSFTPKAITVCGSRDVVYAVSNNAIYSVTLGNSTVLGQLALVAGVPGQWSWLFGASPTHVDGNASSATFIFPWAIAADSAGNVIVADHEQTFDYNTEQWVYHGLIREVLLGTPRWPYGYYPTTVTTLALSAAVAKYEPFTGQPIYSDATLRIPSGLASWGSEFFVTDSVEETVRVLR